MNHEAKTNNPLDYPPFNTMPLLQEKQQDAIHSILIQIRSIIPQKYLAVCKSTNISFQNILTQIKFGVQGIVRDFCSEQPTEQSQSNSMRGNQEVVGRLMEALEESQTRSKKLQIKLLTKIKKLDEQMKEKDLEINQLQNILEEKQIQLQTLTNMNQKKYKQIRKLEEDIFDMEEEFATMEEKLQNSQEMNTMLEKHVSVLEWKIASKIQKQHQGTQTQEEDDNLSQKSSFTENKEKNYIQSIERLTFELTQAYQKINQLTHVEEGKKQRKKSKSSYFNSIFK